MGLTDEKYLALMFSFSRNSPLDLMTPEYGCCLRKKEHFLPFRCAFSGCVVLFFFFLFVWFFSYCSVISFREGIILRIETKVKLFFVCYCKHTYARSVYGSCASKPSLNFLGWMFSFLLTKNQSCLLFLLFLFSVFWKSVIIQLSYLPEFGCLLSREYGQGPLLRAAQAGLSALQTNLFKKISIFLLVFWFGSCFRRRWGQGLVVVFFILHCIVFRLSNLFPPPSYVFSFFFLFFPPSRVFSGKSFLGFRPASVTIHSCTVWFKCFKLPVR